MSNFDLITNIDLSRKVRTPFPSSCSAKAYATRDSSRSTRVLLAASYWAHVLNMAENTAKQNSVKHK